MLFEEPNGRRDKSNENEGITNDTTANVEDLKARILNEGMK